MENNEPRAIPLNSLAHGVPPAAVLRILAQHSREHIEGFITVAIDLLDLADGDPDLEEDDDSGQSTEDEVSYGDPGLGMRGPGCVISDPDWCPIDFGEKTSLEEFLQGCGSAPGEDEEEPNWVAPNWPAGQY